jgi:hypothetical protein
MKRKLEHCSIWPGEIRSLCLGRVCVNMRTHIFDRASGENGAKVFEFVEYMTSDDLTALAKAFVMKHKFDSPSIMDPKIRNDLTSEERSILHKFKVGIAGTYSTSVYNTISKTDKAQRIVQYREALNIIGRIQNDLKKAELEIDDIVLVETVPGDDSEEYHRDGGRDDTDPRMIIYGSDGPGTYFADGDCNWESPDVSTPRRPGSTGWAPSGWKPKNELLVQPEIGKAIIFTGNMCHRRETHSKSRWGFLLNLDFTCA